MWVSQAGSRNANLTFTQYAAAKKTKTAEHNLNEALLSAFFLLISA